MKKIGLAILLLFFASTCFAGYVSVSTTDAFVYDMPDETSQVILGVPQYYPLYVFAKAKGFYKVKDWYGNRGYIHNSDVSQKRTLIVKKFRVNFRRGPSRRYGVIRSLTKGQTLLYLAKKGYYYKAKLVDPPDGTIGWVHRSLVW